MFVKASKDAKKASCVIVLMKNIVVPKVKNTLKIYNLEDDYKEVEGCKKDVNVIYSSIYSSAYLNRFFLTDDHTIHILELQVKDDNTKKIKFLGVINLKEFLGRDVIDNVEELDNVHVLVSTRYSNKYVMKYALKDEKQLEDISK